MITETIKKMNTQMAVLSHPVYERMLSPEKWKREIYQ